MSCFAFKQHFPSFVIFTVFFISLQKCCYQKIADPKLAKLVWQMPVHVLCSIVGLLIADKVPSMKLTISTNNNINDHDDKTSEAYCFFYAYWVSTCFDFFYTQKKRKLKDVDSTMMRNHHITTLTALLFSDYLGYRQMGLFVLYLHDWSDVWIMFLKVAYKLKFQEKIQKGIYAMCICVWIYTRLHVFCYQLCYCLLFGKLITEYRQRPFEIIPVLALYVLGVCNLLWTFMLLKLCMKKTQQATITSYESN